MKCDKVPGNVLKRSVINLIGRGPRIGTDCSVFEQPDGSFMLISTQAGLVKEDIAPSLAVFKACNNIWASGGEVTGISAAFLLQEDFKERKLKEITRAVISACAKCGTYLSGGHTESSSMINDNCVTITAVGRSEALPTDCHRIKSGMDIIMTKWAGLEAAAITMDNQSKRELLYSRFPDYFLSECCRYRQWLTVQEEACIGRELGAVCMHDLSEGGIFSALWDMAEGAGCGLDIDLKAIPVRQQIIEIAEFFNENIYRAKSSGSLLIVSDNSAAILERLKQQEIPACIIGRITDTNDKIIYNQDEIRYLEK